MTRVLIADDQAIFRLGLRRALAAAADLAVVGEAESGEEALVRARETRPDVVLLDLSMPGRGGLETAQELKRAHPRLKVLMLTFHPEDQYAVLCLRLGADGYLSKEAPASLVVQAVRRVAAGGKYVSPALAARLAEGLAEGGRRPAHESLSSREFEVMRKIAAGRTAAEIAAELHLSVKTVGAYRGRVLQKMNLQTNAELVQYVYRSGLAG